MDKIDFHGQNNLEGYKINELNKNKNNDFEDIEIKELETNKEDNYDEKKNDIDIKTCDKDINENIMIMKYKNHFKLKLFVYNFVKNNKNNCKIIYESKSYDLSEYFDILNNENNNKKSIKIRLEGINNITNFSYMFHNCSSLLNFYINSKNNYKKISEIEFMFSGCSSLKSLPDISNWDISNVTNISYLFSGCSSLQSLPDISKWNTTKIIDMNNIFSDCSKLISLPDISNGILLMLKE